jgi:hypothetical protein
MIPTDFYVHFQFGLKVYFIKIESFRITAFNEKTWPKS